jgi:hypothetical protein
MLKFDCLTQGKHLFLTLFQPFMIFFFISSTITTHPSQGDPEVMIWGHNSTQSHTGQLHSLSFHVPICLQCHLPCLFQCIASLKLHTRKIIGKSICLLLISYNQFLIHTVANVILCLISEFIATS